VAVTGDAATLVASLNLHRRLLAPDQIAAIHLLLADGLEKPSGARASREARAARGSGKAAAEVAKKLSVSRATVESVAEVRRKAPEKIKDIAEGKTKATKVLREAKGKSGRPSPSSTLRSTKLASPRDGESPLHYARRLAKSLDEKQAAVAENIIDKIDFITEDTVTRAHSPIAAAEVLARLAAVLAALAKSLVDAQGALAAKEQPR
jgi:hypothetical protein